MRRFTTDLEVFSEMRALPPGFGLGLIDHRDFDTIPDYEYPTGEPFSDVICIRPKLMVCTSPFVPP